MPGYTKVMMTKKMLDNLVIKDYLNKKLETLATKKDLENYPTKIDMKKMENRLVNRIVKKLNIIADHFDRRVTKLEDRTERLEIHTGMVTG
jgi:hypothetical protein